MCIFTNTSTGQNDARHHLCSYQWLDNIRNYQECEGGVEKFVPRITDWHHVACRVMTNKKVTRNGFISFILTGKMDSLAHHLRWYRTHQHMSKRLPSFDTLKNSSKLIYFDKNKRTLPCFFKKLLNFKNRKIRVFQNISFSYFKKIESDKCHIFSWEYATCNWLIKEHKKKTAKKCT